MIILGLFWLSWIVFLLTIKKSPRLQHYLGFSNIQLLKTFTFGLAFLSLSGLSLILVTAWSLTSYLEIMALSLTVLGSMISLSLLLKS